MAVIIYESVLDFLDTYIQKRNSWDTVDKPSFRAKCFLEGDSKGCVYQSRLQRCKSYPGWDELWVSMSFVDSQAEMCPGLKMVLRLVDH